MSFRHYEARVKLPDEVWAAFPEAQLYLSQAGVELRIVIVPAEERVRLPGMVQDQPEVTFLHPLGGFRFGELELPWHA